MPGLASVDDFRAAARNGTALDATVYRFGMGDPQSVAGAQQTKRFMMSDASVDQAGDSIDPKGWQTADFNRNPVALFAHDAMSPPIGRWKNVAVTGGRLMGDLEFATEAYEFARTIFALVDGGYLRACSVGFKPIKWAFANDKNRPGGINFTQTKLLECSVVPIGCHPGALVEARGKGIDTRPLKAWAERVLDGEGVSSLPRKDLETLRSGASDVAERQHFVANLKRTLAPTTPEGRIAEAARLRRSIEVEPKERAARLAEVARLRNSLPWAAESDADRARAEVDRLLSR